MRAVAGGKRVGVTALSHKAIANLLNEVVVAADEAGVPVRVARRGRGAVSDAVRELASNAAVDAALDEREVDVVGGTAWVWARYAERDEPPLDVLFVDEAGQLSLANTLAAATACRELVLLGDPQQLQQPQRGAHPDGADVSALEHLLTDDDGTVRDTIRAERGEFLRETWRMHPALCAPLSELFYEGRLASRPELERQELRGTDGLDGAGFVFAPVEHEGCRSRSDEEVAAVVELVARLVRDEAAWRDSEGAEHALTYADVLIVAPYNAQVARLQAALPDDARVGTVDRFQGQEAPVVIYSMTASSAEDAPRGMEFLFSGNRLNVALSRARCRAIVVASPRLLESECKTPRQMKLANALCRIRETALVLTG